MVQYRIERKFECKLDRAPSTNESRNITSRIRDGLGTVLIANQRTCALHPKEADHKNNEKGTQNMSHSS